LILPLILPVILSALLPVTAALGQEHLVLVQACDANRTATAPAVRFTLGADGTATDRKTGLAWMRCTVGQRWENGECAGQAALHDWGAVLDAAGRINSGDGFAGHTDWRVPTLAELASVVERQCYDPAIDLTVFPATPVTGYWSSSPDPRYSRGAMLVHFKYGDAYMGNVSQYWALRLVRGGGDKR